MCTDRIGVFNTYHDVGCFLFVLFSLCPPLSSGRLLEGSRYSGARCITATPGWTPCPSPLSFPLHHRRALRCPRRQPVTSPRTRSARGHGRTVRDSANYSRPCWDSGEQRRVTRFSDRFRACVCVCVFFFFFLLETALEKR